MIELLASETVIQKLEEEDSKNYNYKMVKKPLHCSFLSIADVRLRPQGQGFKILSMNSVR